MPMQGLGAIAGTAGAQRQASNQPREIGYLDRLSGIESSLSALVSRLESFHGRIHSEGGDPTKSTPQASGIDSLLAASEHHLRCCHALIEDINAKF